MKIEIEPRFFHIAVDYGNFNLFDKLLDEIDPSDWSNQKKLEILYRFHASHSRFINDLTLDRYKKVIDVFKINVNGSCYGYIPMTHLGAYWDYNNHCKVLLDYLLSRKDIKINQPDRRNGFPLLQCHLMTTSVANIDKGFIEKLINLGANINWCDREGQNLLHRYCDYSRYLSSRSVEKVKYLLFQTNIDVEKKDKAGRTPLDLANASIFKEEEAYQKAIREQHSWYTPTRERVEEVTSIRDIIQSRVQGGI